VSKNETPPSPEEKREAAAIRRRWITLGEMLAVTAVVISGLTLWNSYSERTATKAEREADEAEKASERRRQTARSQRITLSARAEEEGKRLALAPLDPGQAIQGLTLAFPSALGSTPVDAVEPRIEARWVRDAARAAREAESEAARGPGDRRLPVALTIRFLSNGENVTETIVYDLGYRIDSSLLGGTDVELRGLAQVARVPAGAAQARLDALWVSRHPAQ
jgi:hypothetical protein